MENGTYQSERDLVRVDLSDGSAETLPLDGETTFAGASGDSVLLLTQSFTFDPMSEEEFLAEHPDGDYGSYLLEEMERAEAEGTTELREYTFDMSDYRMVAEGDVWISPTQALRPTMRSIRPCAIWAARSWAWTCPTAAT